jgi:hypothetical protein
LDLAHLVDLLHKYRQRQSQEAFPEATSLLAHYLAKALGVEQEEISGNAS